MSGASERISCFLCVLLCSSLVQATLYSCNTTAPCGCSTDFANIDARIVGGEPATSHSWGWAVSLRVDGFGHICGGTILSAHYILTAAHCVEDPVMSRVKLIAAVGTDTLYDNQGQRPTVSKITIHPKWNTATKENDIAILKLKNAISFKDQNVGKLCLPPVQELVATEFPTTSSNLVAIGWGSTWSGGSSSNSLQQVTVQAVAKEEAKCARTTVNDTVQFCAAVNGGGKGNIRM